MNLLSSSPGTKTAPGYQPPPHFELSLTRSDNKSRYTPFLAPKAVMTHPVRFDSALAHEIRNPLSNINLSVEMLKAAVKDGDLSIYLDIIMRGSVRINGLVNELLKNQQADEVRSEEISLHQLLDEILVMADDRILLKKIFVKKKYAMQDCKIIANKENMMIALTNIIINAIEAMASEKGILKLVTKSLKTRYVIEIEDNGVGISKENLKNIFKPYYTDKPGGMGLGLSATLDILRANHARLFVRSEPGEGTCFVLQFEKSL